MTARTYFQIVYTSMDYILRVLFMFYMDINKKCFYDEIVLRLTSHYYNSTI